MLIQKLRRIQVGVFVHYAETDELCVLQTGNHAENTSLLRPFEVCLEAYQIIKGGSGVILTQLYYCVGFFAVARVNEPYRLQRTEAHGVLASCSHFLDRHAGFKYIMLKILNGSAFRIAESFPEGNVFLLCVEGAVEVVGAALVVAGRTVNLVVVQGIGGNNRCCRIKEVQIISLQQLFDIGEKRVAGQRAAGYDDSAFEAFKIGHFFVDNGNERIGLHCFGYGSGKAVAVNSQSAAGRHLMLISFLHDEGA